MGKRVDHIGLFRRKGRQCQRATINCAGKGGDHEDELEKIGNHLMRNEI